MTAIMLKRWTPKAEELASPLTIQVQVQVQVQVTSTWCVMAAVVSERCLRLYGTTGMQMFWKVVHDQRDTLVFKQLLQPATRGCSL